MLYPKRKSNLDNYYDESSHFENYSSIININPSSHHYFDKINNEQSQFNYDINDKLYNKLNSFHHSQEKNDYFFRNRNSYPLKLIKTTSFNNTYNANPHINSIKEFSFWDKTLSNLSINKYKQMRENDFKKIPSDMETYRNDLLVEYNNSINDSIDKTINTNKTNDSYLNEKNDNNKTINYLDIDDIKNKKNKNFKNRMRLNKEILNYNLLEKKINKEIEKNNRQKLLKAYKKDYYTHNIINIDDDYKDKKNNLLNEFLLNNIKISNKNSNKKVKRKKENEDDINSHKKLMKRNITFNYNDKEKDENINYNFIKYLKKDNQKLNHINTIYRQLIDTFFYFIKQLSKKYSFNTNIKDVNYYLTNANDLSNILIDLEQHLNKMIKSFEINQNDMEKKNKSTERDKESDNEQELLAKSKFISMDIEKVNKDKVIEKPLNIRNLYNPKKLSDKNKSAMLSKKFVHKTLENNTLNNFNNKNEKIGNKNNNMINKIIKIRKKNGKLMNVMNKLNFGFFSPKQKIPNINNMTKKNK